MPDFPEAPPRPNPFHCDAQRHLWRHGLALAIYEKVGAITRGGKTLYFTDTSRMALFFDANPAAVRRTFAALDNAGWLVVEGKDGSLKSVKGRGSIKSRRWVSHDVWAKANPGKCAVVDEYLAPWAGEADPMVGDIYAAMGGKIRIYESLLKHARSCGRTDSEIVAALAANWRAAKERKARGDYTRVGSKDVFFDTIKALRG
jgi:hypothetical protein